MSYKLYTDKKEIFECKITLEGASLKDATSRMVVNTPDLKLMFEGTIDNNGNCKIPIRKLRGLLGEDSKGTMKLEVIAEDTYFLPWESDFEVNTAKKIKVEVKGQNKNKKKFANILENYSNRVNYRGGTKKFIKEVVKKLNKV